jgi:FtsZ-interacting cell division protein YlmF
MTAKGAGRGMDTGSDTPEMEERRGSPETGLSRTTPSRLSRRTHQVKVLLNEEELEQLDWIVERMGSDRSSVMRHLLSTVTKNNRMQTEPAQSSNESKDEEEVTRIKVGEIPGPWKHGKPRIRLFEPRDFDHVPQAVKAIRNGDAVVVNLTMMEPDQAQRAVDFVAGGAFYGEGHQERVGEAIFLFASREYEVSTMEVLKVIKGSDPEALEASKEIAIGSNDEESPAKQGTKADSDSNGIVDSESEPEEATCSDATAKPSDAKS